MEKHTRKPEFFSINIWFWNFNLINIPVISTYSQGLHKQMLIITDAALRALIGSFTFFPRHKWRHSTCVFWFTCCKDIISNYILHLTAEHFVMKQRPISKELKVPPTNKLKPFCPWSVCGSRMCSKADVRHEHSSHLSHFI